MPEFPNNPDDVAAQLSTAGDEWRGGFVHIAEKLNDRGVIVRDNELFWKGPNGDGEYTVVPRSVQQTPSQDGGLGIIYFTSLEWVANGPSTMAVCGSHGELAAWAIDAWLPARLFRRGGLFGREL